MPNTSAPQVRAFTQYAELKIERFIACIDCVDKPEQQYELTVGLADFHSACYHAFFTLKQLIQSLDDIVPDKPEDLLGWLLAAFKAASIDVKQDGDIARTYLIARHTLPDGLHVEVRLPPHGYLRHSTGKDAQDTSYELVCSLVTCYRKLCGSHDQQQTRIHRLEHLLAEREQNCQKLVDEMRSLTAKANLAGGSPYSKTGPSPARGRPPVPSARQGVADGAAVAGISPVKQILSVLDQFQTKTCGSDGEHLPGVQGAAADPSAASGSTGPALPLDTAAVQGVQAPADEAGLGNLLTSQQQQEQQQQPAEDDERLDEVMQFLQASGAHHAGRGGGRKRAGAASVSSALQRIHKRK